MEKIEDYFNNRIENYKIITEKLKKYKINILNYKTQQSYIIPKLNELSNNIIDNNIILFKQIGSGKNGIIYSGYIKSLKDIYIAIKIEDNSKFNKIEKEILKDLTIYILSTGFPHFPIYYGDFISEYNKKLIILNELEQGDFKKIYNNHNKSILLLNAISQNIISLIFFYYIMEKYHRDAHSKNFLYYKIPKGGYLHYKIYNKDYYIENLGYIFVLWDFQYITDFNTKSINMTIDYERILRTLNGSLFKLYPKNMELNNFRHKLNELLVNYNNKFNKEKFNNLNKEILLLLLNNTLNTVINEKPENIINKEPFECFR